MHAGAMMMAARDATPPPPLPTAPSSLSATPLSGTTIRLTWTDNSDDELHFEIQYDTDSGFGTPTTITPVTADLETYDVTGLLGGTVYYFRARAVNVTGNGAYSNTASVGTLGSAPAKPEQFSGVAAGAESMSLWWTDPGSVEDEFEIQRATNSDFTVNLTTTTVAANVENYTWTGLTASTGYYFRVRANSTASGSSLFATGEGPGAGAGYVFATAQSSAALSAPTDPGVVPDSSTAITLSWTDVSSGTDATQVQAALDSGFTTGVKTVLKNAGTTSHQFTGLTASTLYYFRARTYDVATGAYSDWTSTVSVYTGVPAAPTGHSVTAQAPTTLDHSWTDPANYALTELDVEIDEVDTFDSGALQQDTVSVGTETKQWTGLTEGTVYFVRVRGVNDAGDGAWATATTGTQLAAPTSLTNAEDHGTYWTLTWTDNTAGEANYEVYKDPSGGYALFDTLAADIETYDVAKESGAKWKVRAVHGTLPDSADSNEFTDPS